MPMKSVRLFLCRKLGWHSWKFVGIDPLPTGAYVRCSVCGEEGYQSWT